MLEDAGYTVNVTEFSEWGIAYAALTKGDIQILASQTDYVAQDYWNKNKSRLEKISPVSHGLFDGIAVPSYVTINSIDELNANADKFGGKIIGIEPGAGLMRETGDAVDGLWPRPGACRGQHRRHDRRAEVGRRPRRSGSRSPSGSRPG